MTKSKVITHGCRLNAFESGIIEKALLSENVKNTCVFNTCAVTEEPFDKQDSQLERLSGKTQTVELSCPDVLAQISPNIFAEMPEVESNRK